MLCYMLCYAVSSRAESENVVKSIERLDTT